MTRWLTGFWWTELPWDLWACGENQCILLLYDREKGEAAAGASSSSRTDRTHNVTRLCESIIRQTVPAKSCLEKKENRFEGLVVWLPSKVQWFTATSQYVKMFFTVPLKGDVLESGRFVQLRTLLFFLLDCIDLTAPAIFRKVPVKQKTLLILFKQ